MSNSLENEKNALLARMDVSRCAYRSRYVRAEEYPQADDLGTFPRSRTFKFITRHPYYASIGVAAALGLIPRKPLGKVLRGSMALTAGILGSSARTLMMRQVLPSVLSSLGSRRRRV